MRLKTWAFLALIALFAAEVFLLLNLYVALAVLPKGGTFTVSTYLYFATSPLLAVVVLILGRRQRG
ncbi:MAG: hypothetical protein JWL96_1169 [Sphingomonas bacterium]|uniref:hypothetical protein n=1 Tax=Sphingomonas bacterium TaxID=1895847 RepID=UPI00260B821B|nr:hypothetical protein [Sphingomonas bacterium]MDB5709099.1 hypothetical protein [Sphingomonas bacterium]